MINLFKNSIKKLECNKIKQSNPVYKVSIIHPRVKDNYRYYKDCKEAYDKKEALSHFGFICIIEKEEYDELSNCDKCFNVL